MKPVYSQIIKRANGILKELKKIADYSIT